MNRIWAPWRKAYLRPKKRSESKRCLFCHLFSSNRDRENFILQRSQCCYAVLNLYPYNNGHILVVPNRHKSSLAELSNNEKLDLLSLSEKIQQALSETLKPHGFNLGINLGMAAGAGIPKHVHLHIVPRWKGDVNFMPVISEVKVISESLESVYRTVKKKLKPLKDGCCD